MSYDHYQTLFKENGVYEKTWVVADFSDDEKSVDEENNLINLDPMFTMAPNEVLGEIDIATTDFRLLEGSPAIDAGNPS